MSSNSESVLRYTPGREYTFIHCKYRRSHKQANGQLIMGMSLQLSVYKPWDPHHHLTNLAAMTLKCTDHHKVPWDQDPYGEAKYDGFVFETLHAPMQRWFNQYPRACYGQLDTSHDHFLYLDYVGAGMTTKEVVAVAATDTGMTELQDASRFLSNIRQGQIKIAKAFDWPVEERKSALMALAKFEVQVTSLIEASVGKKLKLMQVMYEPPADNREPVLMDWFEVVFDDDPAYMHTRWEDGRGQLRLVPPVGTEV